MLKTLKIGKNINQSRIFTAKFLGMAIIISTISTSCMAPRPHSIRGKRTEVVTSSPEVRNVERKKIDDIDTNISYDSKFDPEEYMRLLDEANQQSDSDLEGNSQNSSNLNSQKEIPVLKKLDQQLASLNKRQTNTESKVLAINEKIKYLENSIERLNGLIDDMSSHLPPPSVGPTEADTPSSDERITSSKNVNDKKDQKAEFIIRSDEELAEENQKTASNKQQDQIASNDNASNTDELIPDGTPKNEIEKLNELSFSLAEAYLEKNDFGKAITKLQEIENRIEEVTEKSKVNMMLGESHFGLKRYAKAINHFIKVLEMPELDSHDKARMMIADSHLAQGETTKAKGFYSEIVEQNPKSNYIPKAKMMLQRL